MNKYFKSTCIIALCVALSCCAVSCEVGEPTETAEAVNATETNTAPKENQFTFKTVNDLVVAIKRNPSVYANEKITVKGTVLKKNDHNAICDLSDIPDYLSSSLEYDVREYRIYRNCKENNSGIDIVFGDDLSYSVVTAGDYVELCGTVQISNGEIKIDNCKCEIITFASERK